MTMLHRHCPACGVSVAADRPGPSWLAEGEQYECLCGTVVQAAGSRDTGLAWELSGAGHCTGCHNQTNEPAHEQAPMQRAIYVPAGPPASPGRLEI